jgi:membrane protein YdbS with pleckstrin-like domain
MKVEENIVIKCEPHWWAWIGPVIWAVFFALLAVFRVFSEDRDWSFIVTLLVIALIFVVIAICRKFGNYLLLTESKVIGKRGIIRISKLVSPVWKIQGVTVSKGLIGRILGFSTIGVDTAGTGTVEYKFKYIKNADEFQEAFIKVQDEVRNNANK